MKLYSKLTYFDLGQCRSRVCAYQGFIGIHGRRPGQEKPFEGKGVRLEGKKVWGWRSHCDYSHFMLLGKKNGLSSVSLLLFCLDEEPHAQPAQDGRQSLPVRTRTYNYPTSGIANI